MSGLPTFVITTNHSRYVIDQNAGRYSRTAVHEDANRNVGFGVGSDGEWRDYADIYSGLEVGDRLVITHEDGSWLRSTVVQSVEEEDVE